jgi:hypothetical protein
MQNMHPLHLSSMTTMSTSLSFNDWRGEIGRLVKVSAADLLGFLARVSVMDIVSRPTDVWGRKSASF